MALHKFTGFEDSLITLRRRGGPYQKAAERVFAFIGMFASHQDDAFKLLKPTKHGESRIPNCKKYDLPSATRLVTVQHQRFVLLLFVGDHESCDLWLNNNRGRRFTIRNSGIAGKVQVESTLVGAPDPTFGPGASPLLDPGSVFDRLDSKLVDELTRGIPMSTIRQLDGVSAASNSDDVLSAVVDIEDEEQKSATKDTLYHLLAGRILEAEARVRLYINEVIDLSATIDIPEIVDSEFVQKINPANPQYGEVIERFATSSSYKEWMTFLHPDQHAITEKEFDGPARLLGVSGSGKTCVAVRRSVELARRYPDERILILTLNRPLAKLINSLVETCASEDELIRIDVTAFFDLCRSLLLEFDPDKERHYREVTWANQFVKEGEHVDQVWMEFYRCELNNRDASVLFPVHDSLIAQGIRADRYLRDEFDWIRSACPSKSRKEYKDIDRLGRVVPLSPHFRASVLQGLHGWESKMNAIGCSDVLDVAGAVASYDSLLKPRYRCVLVDECQDFGTVELRIIRSLVAHNKDDLFLCGDMAQQVSSRHQNLRMAGIEIGDRSIRLKRNYRNSRGILKLAHAILDDNLPEDFRDIEGLERLDPELSLFEGNLPLLLEASNAIEELQYALSTAKEYIEENDEKKACVAFAGFSLLEVERWASKLEDVVVLNGDTSLETGSLFVSDLEQTKGFEFDLVCIVNCCEGIIPRTGDPDSGVFRDLSRLYVAMTRAKSELILSFSEGRSIFFDVLHDEAYSDQWSVYQPELQQEFRQVLPPFPLDLMSQGNVENIAEMEGERFLFSEEAVGASTELSSAIRRLINGENRRRNRDYISWSSMGKAIKDFRVSPVSRQVWGRSTGMEFRRLCENIGL